MTRDCHDFRARLAQALGASTQRVFAPELEWHTHVLTCGECRALLESEQALEHVLASLPQPTLPPHLARRVLERLTEQRVEAALDRTLDLALRDATDEGPSAPARLASDLLARLGPARAQAERERRLEHALDALLDSAPSPQVPAGLSARVLESLELARRSRATPISAPTSIQGASSQSARGVQHSSQPARAAARPHARQVQRSTRSWAWLAAAGVALFAGAAAWFLSRPSAGEPRREDYAIEVPPAPQVRREDASLAPSGSERVAQTLPGPGTEASELEPDVELLAQLELLESWELLADEALELELLGVDENTLLSLQALEFEAGDGSADGSADGSDGEADDAPPPSAPVRGADERPKNG